MLNYILSYFTIAVRETFNYSWADNNLAKESLERHVSVLQRNAQFSPRVK